MRGSHFNCAFDSRVVLDKINVMPSRNVDLGTIEEWRTLGFFYEVDESKMTWTLRGDRKGLASFAQKVRSYAKDPRNVVIGEHEHFGPYFYLTLTTGVGPAIDGLGWKGRPDDFLRLAATIDSYLVRPAQSEFVIATDYAPGTLFSIYFKIESDGFDPSSADSLIQHRS